MKDETIKQRLRVLNVEDAEDDALLLRRHLQRAGYDLVFERVETPEAMAAALAAGAWDVVIADYSMPHFSAPAALKLLQQSGLDLPFIIVSGEIGEETAVAAMRAGAHDYLMKGNLARLLPAVEREVQEASSRQERRRAEEALRLSDRRIAKILESVTDAFFALDKQWRFTYLNPQAEKLLHRGHADLIDQDIWETFPELAGTRLHEECRRAVVENVTVQLEEYYTPRDKWFEVHAYPSAAGLSVYFQDVTRRKLIEEERARLLASEQSARRQAEEASRLKDEFLATVSHELRTPLTAIVGWASMLTTRKLDEATVQTGLRTIERNARAQGKLIEDILDVSRVITGKIRLDVRPFDPAVIVESALDSVRPAADAKEIQLVKRLEREAGPVSGDPERLQQIVWNLLTNALKFTPQGGRVEVTLVRTAAAQIEISVTDTGQGISAEFLPHVFDRFRQADGTTTRRHGGLGLGLAIVRHLTELHGGTVHAESPGEHRGSKFSVRLPLMVARREAAPPAHDSSISGDVAPLKKSQALDKLKILLVDDEPDTQLLLKHILESSGAEVRSESNVADALATLEQLGPDVIISDIGMPNEDGYELIRRVRALPAERGGNVPAAALTAYAMADDRRRALLAGYQIHLPKPVDPEELVAVVLSLGGRTAARSLGEK